MPAPAVQTDRDERLWNRAKARAKAEGKASHWGYVMAIYQRMKGADVSKSSWRETHATTKIPAETVAKLMAMHRERPGIKDPDERDDDIPPAHSRPKGEGSRGGHIIRHDWRGNPVYAPSGGARIKAGPARPPLETPTLPVARESVRQVVFGLSQTSKSLTVDLDEWLAKAEQLDLFGGKPSPSAPKPPPGYEPIPNSRHGGWRKRHGNSYVRWYPSVAAKGHPEGHEAHEQAHADDRLAIQAHHGSAQQHHLSAMQEHKHAQDNLRKLPRGPETVLSRAHHAAAFDLHRKASMAHLRAADEDASADEVATAHQLTQQANAASDHALAETGRLTAEAQQFAIHEHAATMFRTHQDMVKRHDKAATAKPKRRESSEEAARRQAHVFASKKHREAELAHKQVSLAKNPNPKDIDEASLFTRHAELASEAAHKRDRAAKKKGTTMRKSRHPSVRPLGRIGTVTYVDAGDAALAKSVMAGGRTVGTLAHTGEGRPALRPVDAPLVKATGWPGPGLPNNLQRLQTMEAGLTHDAAGNGGNGGLPEWFQNVDVGNELVRVPVTALNMAEPRPVQLIDPNDPQHRAFREDTLQSLWAVCS